MLVDGEVLNVLRWSSGGGRPPDPFDVQRHTSFLGREVPVVTKIEFRTTGFTQAHLRGARFIGWHTTATLVEHAVQCIDAGEPLVYAYYPGVDSVAHEFGLHDRVSGTTNWPRPTGSSRPHRRVAGAIGVARHVRPRPGASRARFVDRHLSACADSRPRWRATAASATCTPAKAWRVNCWRSRATSLANRHGYGRVPSCSPTASSERARPARFRAASATSCSRRATPVAFIDPALPNEVALRSGHGSLTPDEMYVPLLGARGGSGQ